MIPTLQSIMQRGALTLPPHDFESFTYVSSGAANDDLIATITAKVGGTSGTVVGTLTFAYAGSTNNIASIALTIPALSL